MARQDRKAAGHVGLFENRRQDGLGLGCLDAVMGRVRLSGARGCLAGVGWRKCDRWCECENCGSVGDGVCVQPNGTRFAFSKKNFLTQHFRANPVQRVTRAKENDARFAAAWGWLVFLAIIARTSAATVREQIGRLRAGRAFGFLMRRGCPPRSCYLIARRRRLWVMRWTLSSGPWGRVQWDQGSMWPGGLERSWHQKMVAALNTKFPFGPG